MTRLYRRSAIPVCALVVAGSSAILVSKQTIPTPITIGQQAPGTFADATGHSAQSHLVYAANAGVWWLFTLSSSADSQGATNHIVKTYRSSGPDLTTAAWTAATSSPAQTSAGFCVNCFMGGGRALGVAYVNNAPVDAVHIEIAYAYNGQDGVVAHSRATLTSTSINWGSWNYHVEGAATWTLPRAVTLGVSTSKYIHSAGPILQQEVDANSRKSNAPDTGASWTSGFTAVTVIDNSMLNQCNALAFAPLANGRMLAVYDNGRGTEPSQTNLRYKRSNDDGTWTGVVIGSQLGGDGDVFPTTATINQNDWAVVSVDSTRIYAFRRNSGLTGIDAAAYDSAGNAWLGAAAPPPFGAGQSFKSGAGLFGATDGTSVWLFVIDAGSANAILYSRFDGGTWTPWTAVPGTSAGTHVRSYISGYSVAAANQIGLIWTEGTSPYDVVTTSLALETVPDTTAPDVAIDTPAEGSTVSGEVSIAATASDNVGVSHVQFRIDGVDFGAQETAAPYEVIWDSTTASNGAHTLDAIAADAAGNTTTSSVSVVVSNVPDTTPPGISSIVVSPITETTATISWTTDEPATSRVDFGTSASYGAWRADGALVTQHSLTLSSLSPGTTYHFQVTSADAADNRSSSADASFTTVAADTTPPSATITAPSPGVEVFGTVAVSANASDDVAVAGVQFLLDGANLGTEDTTTPFSVSWNTTTTSNGTHTLAARARDAAGNQTTSPVVTVTVANTSVAAPTVDVVAWGNQPYVVSSVRTGSFSTTAGNELLLAFAAADDAAAGNQVTSVTGGSLTWVLVRRTNVQRGTSEIWRAFAASKLTDLRVTARFSQSATSHLTVVAFSGVDTSGTNGSGAIGATGSGNANPGAPTAALTTTRAGSLVFGVGNDWDGAVSRTVGPGQTKVRQYMPPSGTTLWVQRVTSPIAAGGTIVTINDTAPTYHRYNLTICEIRGRVP